MDLTVVKCTCLTNHANLLGHLLSAMGEDKAD